MEYANKELPVNIPRAKLLEAITLMGMEPKEVASLDITPDYVTVTRFALRQDGEVSRKVLDWEGPRKFIDAIEVV